MSGLVNNRVASLRRSHRSGDHLRYEQNREEQQASGAHARRHQLKYAMIVAQLRYRAPF
jgi:hypothetical protein